MSMYRAVNPVDIASDCLHEIHTSFAVGKDAMLRVEKDTLNR